jgi:hypothetical protein
LGSTAPLTPEPQQDFSGALWGSKLAGKYSANWIKLAYKWGKDGENPPIKWRLDDFH